MDLSDSGTAVSLMKIVAIYSSHITETGPSHIRAVLKNFKIL